MPLPRGRFTLGPTSADLTVRTGTAGPMAKAGHSLEIRMTRWSSTLELDDGDNEGAPSGSLSLEVDSSSLTVVDGVGGPKALTDDDRVKITRTIDERILKRSTITFHSTGFNADGDGSTVEISGELNLLGHTGSATFTLSFDADGAGFNARTEIFQSAFGIEPYSAMMGALRVSDELGIEAHGRLT